MTIPENSLAVERALDAQWAQVRTYQSIDERVASVVYEDELKLALDDA